jgi:hypothetical protein
MQIDFVAAKTLCNASEFSLLLDTRPKSLTQFSAAELKRKLARARELADKWRGQAKRQGYSSNGSAMRSINKCALFVEATDRFQARLAKVGEAPAAKVDKKKLAADALAAQQAANRMAAKIPVKKTAKKASAKKATTKKAPAKKAVAKKAPAKKAARERIDLSTQATQRARQTSSRVAASGKSSRVRGHVSAQGRRNQAARSSRKRS